MLVSRWVMGERGNHPSHPKRARPVKLSWTSSHGWLWHHLNSCTAQEPNPCDFFLDLREFFLLSLDSSQCLFFLLLGSLSLWFLVHLSVSLCSLGVLSMEPWFLTMFLFHARREFFLWLLSVFVLYAFRKFLYWSLASLSLICSHKRPQRSEPPTNAPIQFFKISRKSQFYQLTQFKNNLV